MYTRKNHFNFQLPTEEDDRNTEQKLNIISKYFEMKTLFVILALK